MVAKPVFFVPALLPAGMTLLLVITGVMSMGAGLAHHHTLMVGSMGLLLLGIILTLFATLLAHSAIVHMAYTMETSERVDLGESFSRSWEKLGDLVLAGFIVSVVIAIGFILFFIPGLIAIFFLLFVIQEIILKDKDFRSAISGSISLVKSNFGNTLIFFILLTVVVMIVQFLLGLIPLGDLLATLVVTPYSGIALTLFYLEISASSSEVSSS